MSVPQSKRQESGFQVVDTAISIYKTVLNICLRMPNRYTYLVLQPVINLAGEVMDNVKKANSIIPSGTPPNPVDVDKRRGHFVDAYASLQALITRMNYFIETPELFRQKEGRKQYGITKAEMLGLAEMMRREFTLIKGAIQSDAKRFKA